MSCTVKGSGWDLDTLEPPGLPGVQLEYLKQLRSLPSLSDEAMVNDPADAPAGRVVAQPLGGNAAARLSAAQVRRPFTRRRHSGDRQPAQRQKNLQGNLR